MGSGDPPGGGGPSPRDGVDAHDQNVRTYDDIKHGRGLCPGGERDKFLLTAARS